MRARLHFIDNISWSMIILVLSMQASDTWSPFGNWYYDRLMRIPPDFTAPPPPPVLAAYRAALIYDPKPVLEHTTVSTLALFGSRWLREEKVLP